MSFMGISKIYAINADYVVHTYLNYDDIKNKWSINFIMHDEDLIITKLEECTSQEQAESIFDSLINELNRRK